MVDVRHLSFSYGSAPVLRDVSFTAPSGTLTALLGNNGAGKSTLIACLDKLLTPRSGAIFLDGLDVLHLGRLEAARHIAYVAQSGERSAMSVFDCVLLGRKPYMKWALSSQDLALCEEMLEQVGMAHCRLRRLDRLSGGEVQKVLLARALVQQPRLLLLDEPTSNLDLRSQYEVLTLLRRLVREQNICALLAIHDLNLALRFCDRFVLLRDGGVYAQGDASVLTPDALRAVYGVDAQICRVDGIPLVVPR